VGPTITVNKVTVVVFKPHLIKVINCVLIRLTPYGAQTKIINGNNTWERFMTFILEGSDWFKCNLCDFRLISLYFKNFKEPGFDWHTKSELAYHKFCSRYIILQHHIKDKKLFYLAPFAKCAIR
jgi:hypothetical protein